MHDFVPADHVAHFVRDLVREDLDLTAIVASYDEARGYPPYDPWMMTALLLYGYSRGVYSSRRLAPGCPGSAPRIRGDIATGRQKHPEGGEQQRRGPRVEAMRQRLKRGGRHSRYRLGKQVVEPVFGQIKEARGFRQFLMRGIDKVRGEWALICTLHNILKLQKAS